MSENPYAAKSVALPPSQAQGLIRRDGNLLVVGDRASLPDRCVFCNAPGHHRKTYKLQWHPRWVYWVLLVGPIPMAIVAQYCRKTISIEAMLCQEHRRNRLVSGAILATGAIGGLVGIFWGLANDEGMVAFYSLIGGLLLVLFGAIGLRFLPPDRIEDGIGRLKGCGEAFLETIPVVGIRQAD